MCVQIWLRKSVIIIENQRLGRSALIVDATQAVVTQLDFFFYVFLSGATDKRWVYSLTLSLMETFT